MVRAERGSCWDGGGLDAGGVDGEGCLVVMVVLALGLVAGALIRNTWLQALAALIVLVTVAAVLQAKAPQAKTFGEAVKSFTHPRPAAVIK